MPTLTFSIGKSPKTVQRFQGGRPPVIENAKALFEVLLFGGSVRQLDHVGLGHGKKSHGFEAMINKLNNGLGIHLE